MKNDLWISQNVYSSDELNQLEETILENLDTELEDIPASNVYKSSNVRFVYYKHLKNILTKLNEYVLEVNKNVFGLDLYNPTHHTVGLYNVYEGTKKAEYNWHTDCTKNDLFDLKLTVLVNLSKDYTGGELKLFLNGETIIEEFKNYGAILVFPSWIPHKVEPVTLGTRKTFTLFYTGPLLR